MICSAVIVIIHQGREDIFLSRGSLLLLVTLWLFYAPVNLTIFNLLHTLITNVNF
jgi:hypothetical protein